MDKQTEALKLAQDLRALADRFSDGWHEGIKIDASDIVLLSDAAEALAEQPVIQQGWDVDDLLDKPKQPAQQEPVAWETFALKFANGKQLSYEKPKDLPKYLDCRPLYTFPPASKPWVGLTDEELSEVYNRTEWDTVNGWEYERAIEAKLREKNA